MTPAAIQAALDSGERVTLPAGTVDLGSTGLTVDGDGQLVGGGINQTTLQYAGAGSAITVNSGGGLSTLESLVADLTIDCGGAGAHAITYGDPSASPRTGAGRLADVRVKDATVSGVQLLQAAYLDIDRLITAGTAVGAEAMVGLHAADVTPGQNTTVRARSSRFQQCSIGVLIENLGQSGFTECTFETNRLEGVRIARGDGRPVKSLSFIAPYFENNNTDDPAGAQFLVTDATGSPSQTNTMERAFFNSPAGAHNMRFGVGQWRIGGTEQQTGESFIEDVSGAYLDISGPDDQPDKWVLEGSSPRARLTQVAEYDSPSVWVPGPAGWRPVQQRDEHV